MFSKLRKVEIPSSVTIIESAAFKKCTSLKNIEIPDSVIVIQDFSFSECSSLEEMPILSHQIQLGKSIFDGTPLKKISVHSSVNVDSLGVDEKVEIIIF